MMWTGTDWTVVVSVAAGIGAKVLVDLKWVKKHEPQILKELPKGVVAVGEDIAHVLGGLAKTPFFAGLAAKGKLEVNHVEAKLVDTELAKVAAQTLQAFGNDYASLTANQKSAAVIIARDAFSTLHVDVTDTQIENALNAASKVVKDIQGTQIYQAVAKLEQHSVPASDSQPANNTTSA